MKYLIVGTLVVLAVVVFVWGFIPKGKTSDNERNRSKDPHKKKTRLAKKSLLGLWSKFKTRKKTNDDERSRSKRVRKVWLKKKTRLAKRVFKTLGGYIFVFGLLVFVIVTVAVYVVWNNVSSPSGETPEPKSIETASNLGKILFLSAISAIVIVSSVFLYKRHSKRNLGIGTDKVFDFGKLFWKKLKPESFAWVSKLVILGILFAIPYSTFWKLSPEYFGEVTTDLLFVMIQLVVFLLLFWWLSNSRKKFGVGVGSFVVILVSLFFGLFMVQDESAVESTLSRETVAWSSETKPATPSVGESTLSWEFPPGEENLLYPGDPTATRFTGRAVINRNDPEVFEITVYSRYGGKLASYYWNKSDPDGYGTWLSEGNAVGRSQSKGEWYLKPDGPDQYLGAWRSQDQTGNEWIEMRLRMR